MMRTGKFLFSSVVLFASISGLFFSGSHANTAAADHHETSGIGNVSQSLDPPIGNYVVREVQGKGNQLYRCMISNGADEPMWISVGAEADLFPLTVSSFSSSERTGLHYFLPHSDSAGGEATWSSTATGANASTPPDSTVTGKVIVSIQSLTNDTISSLLLEATGHTGSGSLSKVSYIQRIFNKGGVPPSTAKCTKDGLRARVPYQSHYIFWAQLSSLIGQPLLLPSVKPPADTRPLVSFFGEGFQYYAFNGSTWNFVNVSAAISSGPGQETVGRHYLLPQPDQKGGRLSWETFYPQSIVTAVMIAEETVDPNSITWVLLQQTSSIRDGGLLDSVLWIQRVSTRNGLPPPSSTPASAGDIYMSPFSCIYWFYVNSKEQ